MPTHPHTPERKARGAFFTPGSIARFLSEWAIRGPRDLVLDPSCGEAAFLDAAVDRLRTLGASDDLEGLLHGVDIHEESVRAAADLLAERGAQATMHCGDFFAFTAGGDGFDAVIGNPPYVRYQQFSGQARAAALQAALRQGVRLTGLASSWAAFTVHAASFLKPGGRLALVLPAELLSVNYAAEIRRFLLRRFKSVRLVLFEELVFPGVLEDVVLLLAEGEGGAECFEVYQARNAEELIAARGDGWTGYAPKGSEKWTSALLPVGATELYQRLTESTAFEPMLDWGETYLGAVTGNNNFFSLTLEQAIELKLPSPELVRICPPGAQHLRGLAFTEAAWNTLAKAGKPCYLFSPRSEDVSTAARKVIAAGEKQGVNKAYKCRMRAPWWRVPLVERPDLLFTYMNHERPRLVRNAANVHVLNGLYGVTLKASRHDLGVELLPLAMLNSVSLLGAEIVGRAYGGGMLKHEPKEVDLLPVPSLEALKSARKRLSLLGPQIASQLRKMDTSEAVEIVDRVLLRDQMGCSDDDILALRRARQHLLQRRYSRGKS